MGFELKRITGWSFLCVFLYLLRSSFELQVGVLLGDFPSQEQQLVNRTISKKYAKVSANMQRVSEIDSFGASDTLCKLLSSDDGVVAVFGPRYTPATAILESICLEFEVPYISYSWRPTPRQDKGFFFNFFPETDLYAHALAKIIKSFGWKSFVVVYEKDDTLLKLKGLLDFQKYNAKDKKNKVSLEKLEPGSNNSELFFKIRKSTHTNIILDCKTDLIKKLMFQAKEANLMNVYNNYFLTNLDAFTLDYSDLDTTANITTIRLLDDNDNSFKESVRKSGLAELIHSRKLKTDTALFYDSFIYLQDTVKSKAIVSAGPIYCNDTKTFKEGFDISNSMKSERPTSGLTGPIQFDDHGERIDFNIFVVDVLHNKKIATWFESNGSLSSYVEIGDSVTAVTNLQSTKVIVSSRLGAPYLMLAEAKDEEELEGNARYQGYVLDLIAQIAKTVGFEFEIQLTEDGFYGSYDEIEDKWTGLIGDIVEKRAHLAVCDLTITQEREEVVDFSMPFMQLGISILYKTPDLLDAKYIFISPFSNTVWMTILYSYIFISLCLYVVLRLSPDDWEKLHSCDELDQTLSNRWNIKNSLLLTLRALTMQGSDAVPKGKSARLAISMWWLFCLIITSYYIANLALFANITHLEPEINNIEDLGSQRQIKYGMIEGGSTETFFKNSNNTLYAKMWHTIEQSPSVFTKSTEEGVERVIESNGRYAFLMESSSLEYETERNCELRQIGEWLDLKAYGIAMPQNAPYRSTINRALLKLQEDGTLDDIKKKWWMDEEKEPCDKDASASEGMSPENIGGLFIFLGIGIFIAFVVAIFEFLWNVKRVAQREAITFCEALCDELKMASYIWTNRRKIQTQ